MDILIIYSEDRKGELLSLGTLLYEKAIQFNPIVLPKLWSLADTEEVITLLEQNTHSLFLISQKDLQNPYFVFASGFCLGAHEKTFLLDLYGEFPNSWAARVSIVLNFAQLVEQVWNEKLRWEEHLSQEAAKKTLVERGVEVSNSGYFEAVKNGDSLSVKLFLKAGFSPDLMDKKGVPVLCLAIRGGYFSILQSLLESGAQVNLKSKDRDNTPLMDAAAEGQAEIVQELIERGAQLDELSRNGQTALVLAIGKGSLQCSQILLQGGANPFIDDKLGMSAYKYAQMFGRKDILELMPPPPAS